MHVKLEQTVHTEQSKYIYVNTITEKKLMQSAISHKGSISIFD